MSCEWAGALVRTTVEAKKTVVFVVLLYCDCCDCCECCDCCDAVAFHSCDLTGFYLCPYLHGRA